MDNLSFKVRTSKPKPVSKLSKLELFYCIVCVFIGVCVGGAGFTISLIILNAVGLR